MESTEATKSLCSRDMGSINQIAIRRCASSVWCVCMDKAVVLFWHLRIQHQQILTLESRTGVSHSVCQFGECRCRPPHSHYGRRQTSLSCQQKRIVCRDRSERRDALLASRSRVRGLNSNLHFSARLSHSTFLVTYQEKTRYHFARVSADCLL